MARLAHRINTVDTLISNDTAPGCTTYTSIRKINKRLIKRNLSSPLKTKTKMSDRSLTELPSFLKPYPKHSQSLEEALKGKQLTGVLLKKKQMLEKIIPKPKKCRENVSISQYLHEKGFSYDSQASLVGIKCVQPETIQYLTCLFFKESENPLIDPLIDKNLFQGIMEKLSCKWEYLKDILQEINPAISLEKMVQRLFKKQGLSYMSLIIFLELFGKDTPEQSKIFSMDLLELPFEKSEFMIKFLDVSGGGHLCIKKFLHLFMKKPDGEKTEWEELNSVFWEDLTSITQKDISLVGYQAKWNESHWEIIEDKQKKNRTLCLKRQSHPHDIHTLEIYYKNRKPVINDHKLELKISSPFQVRNPKLSEAILFESLSNCMNRGGPSIKNTFLECFIKKEIFLDQEYMSLFSLLCSEKKGAMSPQEALIAIEKSIRNHGGTRNKAAIIDCFNKKEVNLGTEKVSFYHSLCSQKGGGLIPSEAIKVILRCISHSGGGCNKIAIIECFNEPEVLVGNNKITFFEFLKLPEGGNLSTSEAIQTILRCIEHDGGSQNKRKIIECLNIKEVNLNGEMVTLFNFLRSKSIYGNAAETCKLIIKCIAHDGGANNKDAFIRSLNKEEIVFEGKSYTLLNFLMSSSGGNLSSTESIEIIIRCIGHAGGSRNHEVFLECIQKKEIPFNGQLFSIFELLKSKDGGEISAPESLKIIAKCIGYDSGSVNKQTLLECFTMRSIHLGQKTLTFFELLQSQQGAALPPRDASAVIIKCIGRFGSSQNINAITECFNKKEIPLNGELVPFFYFLQSEEGVQSNAKQAIEMIAKCLSSISGFKNKTPLIECFNKKEVNLDGKMVSLYYFLCSDSGIGMPLLDALQVIIKCIGQTVGPSNKKALLDCINKKELYFDGKAFSFFDFLQSKNCCNFSKANAIIIIKRLIGNAGGPYNKEKVLECFSKNECILEGKRVPLYDFLQSKHGVGLTRIEAFDSILRCLSHSSGSTNKQVMVSCFTEKEVLLEKTLVSIFDFLKSPKGGNLSKSSALQAILRCIGQDGGTQNNKIALVSCFTQKEIPLGDEFVSIYDFLKSNKGGRILPSLAVRKIIKLVETPGGLRNKTMLADCLKEKDNQLNLTLMECFSSAGMTPEEAINLCVTFSVNRQSLFPQDVLKFFIYDNRQKTSVTNLLMHLNISFYRMILSITNESKKTSENPFKPKGKTFLNKCKSIIDIFLNPDGFFNTQKARHPEWDLTNLGQKCIDACALYSGNDINTELKNREFSITDHIQRLLESHRSKETLPYWTDIYMNKAELTNQTLKIITQVRSVEELTKLITLCFKEIERKHASYFDRKQYESSLIFSQNILSRQGLPVIQILSKYADQIFSWFDLKELCYFISIWNNPNIARYIHYFFENADSISALFNTHLKNSFMIYMGLCSIQTPNQPFLTVITLKKFLDSFTNNKKLTLGFVKNPSKTIYPLYSMYMSGSSQGTKSIELEQESIDEVSKIYKQNKLGKLILEESELPPPPHTLHRKRKNSETSNETPSAKRYQQMTTESAESMEVDDYSPKLSCNNLDDQLFLLDDAFLPINIDTTPHTPESPLRETSPILSELDLKEISDHLSFLPPINFDHLWEKTLEDVPNLFSELL